MLNSRKEFINNIFLIVLLSIAIILIVASAVLSSSFLVISGLALIFWVAILQYIKPGKQVPLSVLNASVETSSANIERILTEMNLTEKGVYLPPKGLKDIESSLVFIPKNKEFLMPTPEVISEKLYSTNKDGVFITPPGFSLSRLFEEKLGMSFAKVDINLLQQDLQKILITELELAESITLQLQENTITVGLTNSIFKTICKETNNQPRTHAQIGCLLSSALACVIAKVSGKPIIIQSESQSDNNTFTIEYHVKEE